MAESTKIQWTDATFNPWVGCSKVSEGCKFCYAEELMDHRYHRVQWGDNGTRSRTKTWRDPVKWNREAAIEGKRRKVFCASLADVFEDRRELEPWRADLFDLIDECPMLDWLLLTKRPENILRMWTQSLPNMRENVWLGTSISNQANAEKQIPHLVDCIDLCQYLFLSVEPQIAHVDLSKWLKLKPSPMSWVITGGESKQGKNDPRPYNLDWARSMVDQCAAASIPCFVKQVGSFAMDGGNRFFTNDSHGGDWDEWPEDLRVRDCPESFFPELVY